MPDLQPTHICPSCGVHVHVATTKGDTKIPLSLTPHPPRRGSLAVWINATGHAEVVTAGRKRTLEGMGVAMYAIHYPEVCAKMQQKEASHADC